MEERLVSRATEAPRLGGGRQRTFNPLGFVLLFLAVLGTSVILAWLAYQGLTLLPLALILASGAAIFVLYRPELGVLILISTMLLTYPEFLKGSGLLTLNNVLGLILGLLLLVQIFVSHDLWFLKEREIRLLCFLGFVFVVSTVAAAYLLPQLRYAPLRGETTIVRDFTWGWLQDFFTRGLAFPIFFINFIRTRRQVKYVLIVFLICIVAVIPLAIDAYVTSEGEDFRVTAARSRLAFAGADWLKNENRFAFMCLVGTSLLLYFATVTRRVTVQVPLVAVAMVLVAMVMLAGSRSGFLGLLLMAAAAGIFAFRARPSRGLLAGLGLIGASAVITFLLLTPPRGQERLMNLNPFNPRGEGTHSTQVRGATLAQSVSLFAQFPLSGVGLGNFRWANAYFNGNFKPPHNSYLWALAEGGVFSLVLYLLLFFFLFKRLRPIRQRLQNDTGLPHIGQWLTLYFVLFLFFSLFADIWLAELHLYMIIGLSIVLHRLASEEAGDGSHPSRILH